MRAAAAMEAPDTEDTLYTAHRRVLFDFALRRVGNVTDAENIVQEAFARVIRASREREIAHPRAYLLRTAANLANDLDRARRPLPARPEPSFSMGGEDHQRVRDAVARLPGEHREVVRLRYGDGLSFSAIAAALGLSKNAAHARHKRAIVALRAVLGVL